MNFCSEQEWECPLLRQKNKVQINKVIEEPWALRHNLQDYICNAVYRGPINGKQNLLSTSTFKQVLKLCAHEVTSEDLMTVS